MALSKRSDVSPYTQNILANLMNMIESFDRMNIIDSPILKFQPRSYQSPFSSFFNCAAIYFAH